MAAVREVRRVLDDLIVPMFRNCTWLELAAISLLAGMGEELLFRGVFQARWSSGPAISCRTPRPPQWSAIGSRSSRVAIVFGLLHAFSSAYAVLAALMGLYLGWLWMATGNLAVPIVAHAVYDFLAWRIYCAGHEEGS